MGNGAADFNLHVKKGVRMDRKEALVRDYLAAIERFDAEAALACCTPDMTQIEYPNMLTPMPRTRDVRAMGEGVVAAREMLVEQSYEIVSALCSEDMLVAELVWRARLKPGPLPTQMTAYFACFFTFRDGLISGQRNYDCFARPEAG